MTNETAPSMHPALTRVSSSEVCQCAAAATQQAVARSRQPYGVIRDIYHCGLNQRELACRLRYEILAIAHKT